MLVDDYSSLKVNNKEAGCTARWATKAICDLTPFIASGLNTLNFTVVSEGGGAYLNYYLKITTSVRAVDIV